MDENVGLVAADYVVLTASLLAPLGIGVLFAIRDRKKSTREEYLMGNRQMSLIPVTLSLFVTFQSAISILGIPSDLYMFGAMILTFFLGLSLSYIVGYFFMIPLVYPLKLTSMYEYVYLRYESEAVRKMGTIIGMTQTIFFLAVVLLSPALALQATVSIPLWISVIIIGVIGTVYTAIGGIKSVVWTDTFQTLLLFTRIFTIIIKGSIAVGGLTEAMDIARAGGDSPLISSAQIRDNVALGVLGDWWNFSVGGLIAKPDQVVPFYVVHAMQDLPGMSGLFMATLFSGGLSTLSSGINALSACTVQDILQNQLVSLQEKKVTLVTKAIVAVYGILIVILAYAASFLKGNVIQLSTFVFSAFGSPVVGMIMVGSVVPWANKYGAVVGCLVTLTWSIFLIAMNVLYGRKPKLLPLPSTDKCYSNITSTIIQIENALLSNKTTPDSIEYRISMDPVSTAYHASNTEPVYNTTSASSHDAKTGSHHDFGFFLFDISFEWGSFMGLLVFVIVSLMVSWLTRGMINGSPSPHLLVPCSRRAFLGSHDSETNVGQDSENVNAKTSGHKYKAVATTEDRNMEDVELVGPMIQGNSVLMTRSVV